MPSRKHLYKSVSAGLCLIASLFLFANMTYAQEQTSQKAPAKAPAKAPLKVGFVYTGSISDFGWNRAHDLGRRYLESAMKGAVVTTCAENIPENSDCERIIEKMIAKGNKVIIATSYGFLEPVLRVAARHPDVRFMHCGRPVPPGQNNVGSYMCAGYYESLYAAGVVAGKMTKTNKIGFVLGHPVPVLLWCLNSYTLGVRSVNPKAVVHVVWINTWEDATLESEAARGLIEEGCDILNSGLNSSLTVAKTAEKAGIYSMGTNGDLSSLVPKGWLTGQCFDWGPLYVKVIESMKDGSWKPVTLRFGLKYDYARLASFGKSVPSPLKAQALQVMDDIKTGKQKIFTAPIKDRDGNLRLDKNQIADAKWLESMNWLVPGVQGSLSKQNSLPKQGSSPK